jgi:hypothetical protein
MAQRYPPTHDWKWRSAAGEAPFTKATQLPGCALRRRPGIASLQARTASCHLAWGGMSEGARIAT